jgi:hypothetical protein
MTLTARRTSMLALLLGLLAVACGGETAGEIVVIEVALKSEPSAGGSATEFDTDTGYAVELETARLRLGPIFAFAPEPVARAKPSAWDMLRGGLVSVARAHGGIDLVSGRVVRAEWLEPVTLDALDTATVVLGEIEAEQGVVDAITLELARAASEGAQLRLSGSASRDGERLSFEGSLALGDDPLERRVELVREPIELTDGGRLTIVVHPDVWLRDAEIGRAPVDDGVSTLTPDSQPGRALDIAARSPAAFSFEWRP